MLIVIRFWITLISFDTNIILINWQNCYCHLRCIMSIVHSFISFSALDLTRNNIASFVLPLLKWFRANVYLCALHMPHTLWIYLMRINAMNTHTHTFNWFYQAILTQVNLCVRMPNARSYTHRILISEIFVKWYFNDFDVMTFMCARFSLR